MRILASALFVVAMIAPVPALAHVDENADNTVAPEIASVFSEMQGDLLRCLSGTKGSAYIAIEAAVRNDGTVATVKTTGGALAGPTAIKCVERRVARATFPKLRGAGASKVKAQFTFELV